jgi:hypothetical protein
MQCAPEATDGDIHVNTAKNLRSYLLNPAAGRRKFLSLPRRNCLLISEDEEANLALMISTR